MDNTNIGSEGFQKKIDVTPSSFIGSLSAPSINNDYFLSSIEASGQENAKVEFKSGAPVLEAPNHERFIARMELEMSHITTQVLKAWSKSIEEEAELVKEMLNSPSYLAKQEDLHKVLANTDSLGIDQVGKATNGLVEKYAWLQALSGVVATAVLVSEGRIINGRENNQVGGVGSTPSVGMSGFQGGLGVLDSQGNVVGYRDIPLSELNKINKLDYTSVNRGGNLDGISTANTGSAQFLLQSLLIAASEIVLLSANPSIAAVAANNAMHAEAIVFKDAWNAITVDKQNEAAQIAGWLSALWGIGLIYRTSAENLKEYANIKEKPSRDIDFAKQYAANIISEINSPQFNSALQSAIVKAGLSAAVEDPGFAALVAKAKLLQLSLALALMVKLEVGSRADEGWINELDFIGLLNGQTDISKNDLYHTAGIKRALIAEISFYLQDLSSVDRQYFLANIMEYMSTNPSIEDMLSQQSTFNLAFKPSSLEREFMDKRPID